MLSDDRLSALGRDVDSSVFQNMPPRSLITMMFTDIVDSTRVKAEMGDTAYLQTVLEPHNQLVLECVAEHNGRALKSMGDAFLVCFFTPQDGVACACEIQQRLAASPIPTPSGPVAVRIGLHTGTPLLVPDAASGRSDISGTDVDKAARLEAAARGSQVLISEVTKVLSNPQEVHDWGRWELKGLGPHRLFEVLWPGPPGMNWETI